MTQDIVQDLTSVAGTVLLSAHGADRLRRYAARVVDRLTGADGEPDTSEMTLAAVAHTLQTGRAAMPDRLAVTATDLAGAVEALAAFVAGLPHPALRIGTVGDRPPSAPTTGDASDPVTAWLGGAEVRWRDSWPSPPVRLSLPAPPWDTEPAADPAPHPATHPDVEPAGEAVVQVNAPRPGAGTPPRAVEAAGRYVLDLFAAVSGIAPAELDLRTPLADYGIGSFLVSRLNARLEAELGERERGLFFAHRDLAGVAGVLAERHGEHLVGGASDRPVAGPVAAPAPGAIAIVGLAGRYPKAPDLDRLWENLVGGVDCVGMLPEQRRRPGWPVDLMWGGFLDEVDRFDPLLFGMTPRDAELMDPQERLFLEVVWEALEDACYPRSRLAAQHGSRVAVYAGAMYNEYPYFGVEQSRPGARLDTGATLGGVANRVSFHFDLHGPSLTVDTMCSSSLVAIDLAVKALRANEAEVAIAGAVNLSLHPNKFVQHHRMRLAAPGRRCRSFGADGDGFVPSEGAGVVVLKPLAAALRDGDRVHGVVRGTSVVHAGRTNGYLVPDPLAQTRMVEQALRDGGVDPATIDYVEAHGAGTELGDPVEIEGLLGAFAAAGRPVASIPIGSVKSTIGHVEAAAGIAGLTKVLLQMRHRTLVPSLHADRLNPQVPWDAVPFRVQRTAQPWEGSGGPLRAGVSSFGAGGTIAHVVVEAPPEAPPPAAPRTAGPQLVVLSARDEERLRASAGRLAAALGRAGTPDPPDRAVPDLAAVARTLQIGREPLPERAAVVVGSVEDLRSTCERFADGIDGAVVRGRSGPGRPATRAPGPGAPVDLAALARHWVAGGEVDWRRLHPGDRPPGTVALPSYPFARRRCWVPEPAPPAGPTDAPPAPLPVPPVAEVPLYRRTWAPAGPVPAPGGIDRTTVCVHSDASAGLARELARHAPGRVLLVREGGSGAAGEHGYVTAADAELLADALLRDHPDLGGWLDLADLFRPSGELGTWHARLAMLRRVVGARARGGLRVLQLTSGLIGPDGPAPTLAGARTAGFVRVLGADYRELTASVLDTDRTPGEGPVLRHEIEAEWSVRDGYGEIAHRAGLRFAPALEALDAGHRPLAADPTGVHVVTGGTRGLGALVARTLVDRGARKLVLCGTRPVPDPAAASTAADLAAATALAALRARGADVLVHPHPLADRARLRETLDRARAQMGRLVSVVHCAGRSTGEPTAFANRAPQDSARVLEPKVDGLDALLDLTAADDLDSVLLFSSVCAAVPSLAGGVTDYAAANTYLDLVAAHDHRAGSGRIRSVNWPQWTGTGGTSGRPNPCAVVHIAGLSDEEGLQVVERVLAAPPGPPVLPAPPAARAPDLAALVRVREVGVPAAAVAPLEPSPAGPARPARWLVEVFARTLHMEPEDLDVTAEFGDLGVESVMLGELLRAVEAHLGRLLEPAILLENPTLTRLSAALGADEHGPAAPPPVAPAPAPAAVGVPARTADDERIAVVGMACRFPGAPDTATFWSGLVAGRCTVDEVPPERWDHRLHYRPHREPGTSISRWGGFVTGIEDFDPGYFGMGDAEAAALDPSIRLLLETATTCLAEAGYVAGEIAGNDIGVFVGACMSESYGRRTAPRKDMLRSDQNFIAAHLAQHLDLRGPAMVVDSACSSSLVAVQMAVRSLLAGETGMAFAGGVEVLLDEQPYVELSAARVLSPSGRCRVFDERADGFVPGEGCGVVLLKRLADAIADGDRIHAVIEGVAVNNDGRTMGMTTPSLDAQMRVVRRALAIAGRAPHEIGMVEAHGTGTMIGDPTELRALTEVFGEQRPGSCPVGSVKSNMGHLLSAAGIAGLIKVVLSLDHGRVPATLFCDTPNPRFDFARSPLFPVTSTRPWPATGTARVAGVSSFGLGGTNAHLVACAADPAWWTGHPRPRRPLPPPVFRRRRLWLDPTPATGPGAVPPEPDEPLVASMLDLQLTVGGAAPVLPRGLRTGQESLR